MEGRIAADYEELNPYCKIGARSPAAYFDCWTS